MTLVALLLSSAKRGFVSVQLACRVMAVALDGLHCVSKNYGCSVMSRLYVEVLLAVDLSSSLRCSCLVQCQTVIQYSAAITKFLWMS